MPFCKWQVKLAYMKVHTISTIQICIRGFEHAYNIAKVYVALRQGGTSICVGGTDSLKIICPAGPLLVYKNGPGGDRILYLSHLQMQSTVV